MQFVLINKMRLRISLFSAVSLRLSIRQVYELLYCEEGCRKSAVLWQYDAHWHDELCTCKVVVTNHYSIHPSFIEKIIYMKCKISLLVLNVWYSRWRLEIRSKCCHANFFGITGASLSRIWKKWMGQKDTGSNEILITREKNCRHKSRMSSNIQIVMEFLKNTPWQGQRINN